MSRNNRELNGKFFLEYINMFSIISMYFEYSQKFAPIDISGNSWNAINKLNSVKYFQDILI